MLHRRQLALVAVVVVGLGVAACSTPVAGSAAPGVGVSVGVSSSGASTPAQITHSSTLPTPTVAPSSSTPPAGDRVTTPTPSTPSSQAGDPAGAQLAATLHKVSQTHRWVVGTYSGSAAAAGLQEGDLIKGVLSAGVFTDVSDDATGTVNGRSIHIRLIRAAHQSYVASQPLSQQLGTTKTWVRANPSSSDPIIRSLDGQVESALGAADVDNCAPFAQAATHSSTLAGTFAGQQVDEYVLAVPVDALAKASTGSMHLKWQAVADQLRADPLSLGVTLWVDHQANCLGVWLTGGTAVSSKLSLQYGSPQTISPPPASDVYTG